MGLNGKSTESTGSHQGKFGDKGVSQGDLEMNPKSLLPLVDVLFAPEEREEVRARLLAEPIPYWKSKKGKEYVKKYRRLPK